ncbi:MAG: sigma-54 dependent transcriptional regulator [Thermoanaerobaculia bacterium]
MKILIIEDNPTLQGVLREILEPLGEEVISAYTGEEGLKILKEEDIDLVLLDLMLPKISGLEVLDQIKKDFESIPVIVITAYASIDTAIDAMKRGAFHYIPKPFKNEEILIQVKKALEQRALIEENIRLKEALLSKYSFENIIGKSPDLQRVFELIKMAAPSNSNILITGESGTGKELVARAIHLHSKRKDKPFIPINCGTMDPILLESQLFGHKKGAFTGAVSDKKGLLEVADGGSLFMDEIGSIPVETQAKILRVIQEKEFLPLGDVNFKKVDVRLISATNVDLNKLIEEGKFRQDLYYRLNVIHIHLPPLKDRKEDIPLLVDYFLKKFGKENEKEDLKLKPETLKILMDYDWPGNVRELENAIERAVVLCPEKEISPEYLPKEILRPTRPIKTYTFQDPNFSYKNAMEEYQRKLIIEALEKSEWIQRKAANLLKIKPSTLSILIKKLKI